MPAAEIDIDDKYRERIERIQQIRREKAAAAGTAPGNVRMEPSDFDRLDSATRSESAGVGAKGRSRSQRIIDAARSLAGGESGEVNEGQLMRMVDATLPNEVTKVRALISALRGQKRFAWTIVGQKRMRLATPPSNGHPKAPTVRAAPPPAPAPPDPIPEPEPPRPTCDLATLLADVDRLFDAMEPGDRTVASAYVHRRFG